MADSQSARRRRAFMGRLEGVAVGYGWQICRCMGYEAGSGALGGELWSFLGESGASIRRFETARLAKFRGSLLADASTTGRNHGRAGLVLHQQFNGAGTL